MAGCEHNAKLTSDDDCTDCASLRAEMTEFWDNNSKSHWRDAFDWYKHDATWYSIVARANSHCAAMNHQTFLENCYDKHGCHPADPSKFFV